MQTGVFVGREEKYSHYSLLVLSRLRDHQNNQFLYHKKEGWQKASRSSVFKEGKWERRKINKRREGKKALHRLAPTKQCKLPSKISVYGLWRRLFCLLVLKLAQWIKIYYCNMDRRRVNGPPSGTRPAVFASSIKSASATATERPKRQRQSNELRKICEYI